jgi:cytochrome c
MADNLLRTLGALLLGTGIAVSGPPALAADPAAGAAIYKTQCAVCHPSVAGKNSVAPTLFGIVGRQSGTVSGFRYSPANQNANIVWNEPTLDKYLQSPNAMIPGTIMVFPGIKDDVRRADLVAYIATLK